MKNQMIKSALCAAAALLAFNACAAASRPNIVFLMTSIQYTVSPKRVIDNFV
jgi:hypothetical protein